MCILFIFTNANPSPNGYKLILVSNRDEFYIRPALPVAEWIEHKSTYGGRDMEKGREGGTWLAMSTKGNVFKLGALLNITGEKKSENALPRGNLVADYVTGTESNEQYCQNLVNSGLEYNGFNLVTVEIGGNNVRTIHCSNVDEKFKEWPHCKFLGFGNSPPNSTLEKVKAGKQRFEDIVKRDEPKELLVKNLMLLLQCRDRHWPDSELYKRAPEWAEQLSAIGVHIKETDYGSRTRSVILVDAANNVDFYEETMLTNDPSGEWKKTHLVTKI